jgi:glutathione S-transferase
MQLRTADASPFGRKARIAADLLGFTDLIAVTDPDTRSPDPGFLAENPLGKVPALIAEDGSVWFDSRVIVEYLDHRAGGGRLIPADPAARLVVRRTEALADGLLDAAVLLIYERRWRAEDHVSTAWLAHQRGKLDRALAAIAADPPAVEPITVGTIAVACALGYLDLRFDGVWRSRHPELVAWLDGFAARVPAFAGTALPPGAP